ncbi:MAG: lipopolysaccharide biosynthesis protein [Prevotellaceae bacterium]|nr:lipopolysaccharide biosynthesis protein [Prevotellaceae bacterium]
MREREHKTLKQRTASGLLWGILSNGSIQLLSALFGIVLLRLLQPSDYGKIAMLLVFANVAATLQESGFTAGLCNLGEPRREDYNAVFWFNILVSAVMYLVLFLLAPLIARFYHDPELLWLSRYLFLAFFISSWGQVQRAYLFIHLMQRQTCIIAIVSLLLSGVVGVTMAYNGYAYWGLASQTIVFTLSVAVLNWCYSPWRPSLHIDLRPAFAMFGFSGKLLLTNLFTQLNAHAFGVLLGRFYGDHSAGIYSNARKWDDMSINTVNGMVSGVAQPVLTQVREERERYCRVFRKMLRFVCFVSFPAMLGIGSVAREFLLVVGGEKWVESATILSMLSVYGAFFPLTTLYSNLAISKGRSNVNLWCTVAICLIIWAGLIALRGFGIRWMVVFFVTVNILWLFVWHAFARRLVGLRLWDVLRDVLPFLLFTVAVLALTFFVCRPISSTVLRLVSKVLLAAALYLGLMWLSGARVMREAVQYLIHHDTRCE